jgi:hypothetical protein
MGLFISAVSAASLIINLPCHRLLCAQCKELSGNTGGLRRSYGLCSVAFCLRRIIVHLYHESVSSGGSGGKRHGLNIFCVPRSVTRIDDYRQDSGIIKAAAVGKRLQSADRHHLCRILHLNRIYSDNARTKSGRYFSAFLPFTRKKLHFAHELLIIGGI